MTEQTPARRRPYNADGVRYVDAGPIVTAVWVSDPAVDPAEALDKILHRDLPYEVEIIAEATRHYRKEGADFSGWIISQPSSGNYSTEPITRKPEAIAALREWVAGVFEDRAARRADESAEEAPQEPVKVRFSLSEETRAQLRESGQRARDEYRAEMDEHEATEARAHGVPVRPEVAARIAARQQQAARLPIGTRVRHAAQQWATSALVPEGTAIVVGVGREHADGSVEYKVLAGQDFSRHIGPDNPMDKPEEWNSTRVLMVAPPYFEMPEAPEGCRFEITREHGRTIVRMYDGVTAAPEFEAWTYHGPDSDVVPAYARDMARVHNNAMAETRALLALDDETVYQVSEYRASMPTGDPVTMTGRQARARLQAAREEAGPERLNGYSSPRFTLEHSGAHWWATTHAYKGGQRDQWNRRHIAVRPLVTAHAAHVLMQATGDGCIMPVEKPSVKSFGPWVRPVEGEPTMVRVNWVTCGTPVRPGVEKHADVMATYGNALKGAGWRFQGFTEDGGMVFQEPAHTA